MGLLWGSLDKCGADLEGWRGQKGSMPHLVGVLRPLLSELWSVDWACSPDSQSPEIDPFHPSDHIGYQDRGGRLPYERRRLYNAF